MRIMDQIKGHEGVKKQLLKAVETKRLPHALLFSGPSGVGKRKTAWALAQSLLCQSRPACGTCRNCLRVFKKQNENILTVSKSGLQNIRLQDLEKVRPFLSLQSFAPAKVVLMDEAESLNIQSVNFLLKIIEEPPPQSFFILIASNCSKMPLTLRSRLQNICFSPLPENIVRALAPTLSPKETPEKNRRTKTKAPDRQEPTIAQKKIPEWMIKSAGGQLDRLEELSQKRGARDPAFALLLEVLEKPSRALCMDFPKKIDNREHALAVCRFWQEFLRDIRFIKAGRRARIVHTDKYKDMRRMCSRPHIDIDRWMQGALQMEANLRAYADYNLSFENFALDCSPQ